MPHHSKPEPAAQQTMYGQAEPEMLEPLLVRVDVAARLLSVGRTTVYELMDTGQLPFVKIGTARRIPTQALKAWVEEHTRNGA